MSSALQPVARDERLARLTLACVTEPGDPDMAALVAAEGAEAICGSLTGVRSDTRWGRRLPGLRLDAVREAMLRTGLRFVVPGDPEWAEGLDDLTGVAWGRAAGPPLGLWVGGPGDLREWASQSVAVVGSRACTPYGEAVAGDLAADLAASGVTVVSGGAYGIDICAHRGAMAAGGRTVAVLASGADQPYPRGNARALETIRAQGLVVSELPPGEHPSRPRFLSRNRLIAALAKGTVVVEAGYRSGAKNTVSWAQECFRPVMAVPGPVTSTFSAGTHQLIRERKAELVTSAAEIREVIAPAGQDLLPLPQGRNRAVDRLDDVQRDVFEVVPGRGGRGAEEIAIRCGRSLLATLSILGELEELGLVLPTPDGGWRLRPGSVG